jgi:hypothetical protein
VVVQHSTDVGSHTVEHRTLTADLGTTSYVHNSHRQLKPFVIDRIEANLQQMSDLTIERFYSKLTPLMEAERLV